MSHITMLCTLQVSMALNVAYLSRIKPFYTLPSNQNALTHMPYPDPVHVGSYSTFAILLSLILEPSTKLSRGSYIAVVSVLSLLSLVSWCKERLERVM